MFMKADLVTFQSSLAALLTLITAVITLFTAWKTSRKVDKAQTQIDEVHVLVNSRLTNVMDRVEQLTRALEESDSDVPPDPNP